MNDSINGQISNKNLRATALDEFWDNKFDESIYFWPGAKHGLLLEIGRASCRERV